MRLSTADPQNFQEFGTLRINCQPVRLDDVSFYKLLFSFPEISAFRPGGAAHSDAEIAQKLDRHIAHWQRHGFGQWMLSHAGQMIGIGGLSVRGGFSGLKLSYHLLPEMWGQGLASEFVRASLDYARDSLGSEEVFGLVRPTNIASIRVLEKAEFRDSGLLDLDGGPMRELRRAL